MSTFRTNDGVEIYYEVRGEGRPLLMLPGWTCSTKFWTRLVDGCVDLVELYRAVR